MSEKKPTIRFKGFDNDWEQRKLGEVATRVTRKNKKLESTLPLTISAQFGLVDQNTFFNKQIASKDVSGYYLLKKGEFAYNKSYSNGYPWGAVKRLDKYDMGVLSTLYICFRPVDINSDFLASYYDTDRWYKEVSKHAAEGVRNHGLLNIAASDFFETELMIPKNNNEQEKIADFFKSLDTTITLHQQQLENLKKAKKGYLQKMFPKNNEKVPEIRFEGFTDDWEQRKLVNYVVDYIEKTTVQNQYPVLTSSQQRGILLQEEYFASRQVTTNDNVGYFVLPRGYFTFRSRSDNDVFVFNRNDIIDKGIISYFYPVFTLKNADSDFFLNRINNGIQRQISIQAEGTGQHVLSLKKFKNIVTMFPLEAEQQKIGSFFKQLDNTITLHQRKLDYLKEMKKGLLQKMFV